MRGRLSCYEDRAVGILSNEKEKNLEEEGPLYSSDLTSVAYMAASKSRA